ncbi:Colicin V production protein [Aquimixticola soesokkakensis]|uniref:Colicin V production protein n=1 Tax=Aquimixticola soesokkakensis TaxID=1519096 RepID=A0A1Y5S284_9RHOB|nr:CvpA family protein [Aquimixticola soesokkakensis]SLN29973.1 Colicin V production protein [Aquimixticola soesokkakensis]
MDGFTIIDGIVALIIIISAILAYSRGVVRELMAIAGWVAAAVLGYIFAPQAVPLVKEIPYIGNIFADSCELATIAGFGVVAAIALVIVSVFTPLFASAVQRSALGGLDQGLGFVFGVLRGIILVAVAMVVYDRVVLSDSIPVVDNSRTAKVFARSSLALDEQMPEDAPGWIVARYESLVSTCTQ